MLFNVLFIFVALEGLVLAELDSNDPVVELPQGQVQGTYQKSYRGKTFSSFEGIPYAAPPTGDLRFKEPKPAAAWNGTLVANKAYECLHFMPLENAGPRGSEDCLYIYVYVPRTTIDPNELLDVVVHIHGGGFMMSSPKLLAGPEFLMDRDVIVVSFNYRLGILGFLSTEDSVVPGNNGLKDQSLALAWIKDNIKYFGGNPDSVTLTGTSAGGASVHLHYFSPLSKGLFHRGFSQSGTALVCWALAENSLYKAETVAKNVSCPTSSTQEMVQCLQKVDANKLINGIRTLFVYMDIVPFSVFGPVVEQHSENAFLSEHPYKTLQEGNIYDVPWVASNTKGEGLYPIGFFTADNKLEEVAAKWYDIMQYALELHYTVEPSLQKDVLTKINEYYLKGKPFTADSINSLVELFSDRMFLVDTEKSIRIHAQVAKSKVYYSLYTYVFNLPRVPPGTPNGAAHGDDGRLLFRMLGTPEKLPKNDETVMEYFVDFITTFAKDGTTVMNSVEWLPVKPGDSDIDFLEIGGPDAITMKRISQLAPKDFWDSLPIKEGQNAVTGSSNKTHERSI